MYVYNVAGVSDLTGRITDTGEDCGNAQTQSKRFLCMIMSPSGDMSVY